MTTSKYRRLFDEAEKRVGYWRELALTEFVVDLTRRMDERGISRASLASALDRSRAHVTKALRGDANLTLESMVRFAMVVDGVVHLHIADKGSATTWKDRPLNRRTANERAREATMRVPLKLVPKVRELIAKQGRKGRAA